MSSRLILFVSGFIVWLLLTWPPKFQEVIAGVFAAGLVSFLTGTLFVKRPHLFRHLRRYLWFLYYFVFFVWECFKANIDVAYRVLHPRRPLKPGIVKVHTKFKSDTALTFLANSITLTPGTLTVDIDPEQKVLYVHWIDVKTQDSQEATKRIVERFEKILEKVFEE